MNNNEKRLADMNNTTNIMYGQEVDIRVRDTYSRSDELAIHRHELTAIWNALAAMRSELSLPPLPMDGKSEEFYAYDTFAEKCKVDVQKENSV